MPTKKTTETPYHHGNLKADALTKAFELVTEQGESAMTMRAIATRLGVSHKALYRHFENQSDFSMQVAAKIYDLLSARFASHSVAGARDITRVYAEFAFEYPHLYDFAFGKNVTDIQQHGIAQQAVMSLTKSVSDAYLRGHKTKDRLTAQEVRDQVVLLWSVVHGTIDLANRGILRSKGPAELKDYLMTIVDRVS